MKLRDYQKTAVKVLVKARRGILKSPAGSGKSLTGAAVLDTIAFLEPIPQTIFWIANTQEQVDQAWVAISNFPDVSLHDITVCCYAASPDLSEADIVILDECHHCGAPTIKEMLSHIPKHARVYGLSATPDRVDEEDVRKIIGPILHEVPRQALLDAGNLAPARVRFHTVNSPGEFETEIEAAAWLEFAKRLIKFPQLAVTRRTVLKNAFAAGDPAKIRQHLEYLAENDAEETWRRCLWQCCTSIGITHNEIRNVIIQDLAVEHYRESVLILVGSIEHGEMLRARLPDSVMAHSKMGAKKRAAAMDDFRAGRLKCMIGTSLLEEGADLPCASVLICASAGRSARKATQSTGRVLRTWSDKTHGQIEDFLDVGFSMLENQSYARKRVYQKLGYGIL